MYYQSHILLFLVRYSHNVLPSVFASFYAGRHAPKVRKCGFCSTYPFLLKPSAVHVVLLTQSRIASHQLVVIRQCHPSIHPRKGKGFVHFAEEQKKKKKKARRTSTPKTKLLAGWRSIIRCHIRRILEVVFPQHRGGR